MDALPSCSHAGLELERDTDGEIEWISEVGFKTYISQIYQY